MNNESTTTAKTREQELREVLERIWEADEMGYILDKEEEYCVGCHARRSLPATAPMVHADECVQGWMEKALHGEAGVPIDVSDVPTNAAMQRAAAAVKACVPDYAFVLIAMPFQSPTGFAPGTYASNCNREDAVKILKTLLFRWGIDEEWMLKAK